jgi:hypothetical protein
VGLFAHWVLVKGTAEALVETGYGETDEAEAPGWLTGYPVDDMQLPKWDDFEATVARVAASAGGPALGSWVYDSDVGYLAAADDRGAAARLVINPDACDAYDLPLPDGWPDRSIASFVEWSNGAPNAVDTAAVAEIVERDWTFAEEGVTALHERLGLSTPYESQGDVTVPTPTYATVDSIDASGLGGYERSFYGEHTFRLIQRELPWKDARYVGGYGAGSSASGIASVRMRRSSSSPPTTRVSLRRTRPLAGSSSKTSWRARCFPACGCICLVWSLAWSSSRFPPPSSSAFKSSARSSGPRGRRT